VLPGDLGVGDLLPAPPDDARSGTRAASLEGGRRVSPDWGETTWAMPGTEPGRPGSGSRTAEPLAEGLDDEYDVAPEDLDGAETVAAVVVTTGASATVTSRDTSAEERGSTTGADTAGADVGAPGRPGGPAAPRPGALGHRPRRHRAALVHQ